MTCVVRHAVSDLRLRRGEVLLNVAGERILGLPRG
jgi:hypothetical protein